jgi:hypothetical protein
MNGVYLNGERVMEAQVKAGDRLGIGGFKFNVEVVDPQLAPDLGTNARERAAEPPILGILKPPDTQESERRKAS